MIHRLHPEVFTQSPLDTFSLLLLGQGFAPGELSNIAREAWTRIGNVSPFSLFKTELGQNSIAVFWDDSPIATLGITQTGNVLTLPSGQPDRLREYLSPVAVGDDQGNRIPASAIWPVSGRTGIAGSLVAVLVKGTTPGELYQLDSSPTSSVPLVAVVVAGEHWEKVLARAIGQTLASLGDEFERPGPEFAKAPEGLFSLHPNVVYIDDQERDRISRGERAQIAIPHIVQAWQLSPEIDLDFRPHTEDRPNPLPATRPTMQYHLVEGAGGYRRNALRADVDCLMRRIPASTGLPDTARLPVQAEIAFCFACDYAITSLITSQRRILDRPAIRIDTQRLQYDRIRWRRTSPFPIPARNLTLSTPAVGPQWSCMLSTDAARGLVIENLRLLNRPDPFAAATNVARVIEFQDLSITLDTQTVPLRNEEAMANRRVPPRLEAGFLGGFQGEFQFGAKLTLTWDLPTWSVEVVTSLVVRSASDDLDPGGAIVACKLFPQISMRYYRRRRRDAGARSRLPRVRSLHGTVAVTTNNVIPRSLEAGLPPQLQHMASGIQQVGFFTDSNTTDSELDNVYSLEEATVRDPIAFYAALLLHSDPPEFPLRHGRWVRGRKLAGVVPVELSKPRSVPGGLARWVHLYRGYPGLPHWSWLFDYAFPELPTLTPKRFDAVYSMGDPDPAAAGKASPRTSTETWPAPPYTMTVRKVPRQGAYDNFHVSASMGLAQINVGMGRIENRSIIGAPFCGDTCLHLHWRWGIVGLRFADDPYQFVGWGSGRLERGAHTQRGAPGIPPNQHLDLEVVRQAIDETLVRYAVTAYSPGVGERQIFLEQGFGFAFNYLGRALLPKNLAQLAVGVGAIIGPEIAAREARLRELRATNPAQFDVEVRALIYQIYTRMRFYDLEVDGFFSQQTPDLPEVIRRLEVL